jgi:hypothetical protein
MDRQPFSAEREIIVAEAIREVVSELRLVEVADYIAYLRLERMGNISDLVESAAELHFMPGTLRLGHGGEASVSWSEPPQIVLDLELRPQGANVYFQLTMADAHASVQVNYVSFDEPSSDPLENNRKLEAALEASRIRKSETLATQR